MSALQIERIPGRLGIDIRAPQLGVNYDLRENEIEREKGEFSIERRDVRVEVDNYPARYDLGYRNIGDFLGDVKGKGARAALERTGQYADQGDRLADFKKTDIARIVKEETTPEKKEVGLVYKRGPEITVRPAAVEIKASRGRVRSYFDLTRLNRPRMNFRRGQVEIYLLQNPELNIRVRGQEIDQKV